MTLEALDKEISRIFVHFANWPSFSADIEIVMCIASIKIESVSPPFLSFSEHFSIYQMILSLTAVLQAL